MAGTKAHPAISMVTVKSQVSDYESAAKEADLDIVLVVDVSVSMDGAPLQTMKSLLLYLIDQLKENHRLGKSIIIQALQEPLAVSLSEHY